MADAEQRVEEFESLEAIYGDDVITLQRDDGVIEVAIPTRGAEPHAVARATCPSDYPSASPPVVEVIAPHLPAALVEEAAAQLEELYTPGEVVLFAWLEWLRERHEAWDEQRRASEEAAEAAAAAEAEALAEETAAALSLRQRSGQGASGSGSGEEDGWEYEGRGHDEAAAAASAAERRDRRAAAAAGGRKGREDEEAALMAAVAPRIISGEPFTERRSTFQAHVCRVTDAREVGAVISVLLQNNKIANATHPAIMAYRIATGRPGVFLQDCDDDGEDAAGGRLLHLLQLAKAENVVVVVSRWFGGVLLGPSRFGLINNCARELLVASGFIGGGSSGASDGGKKRGGGGKR